MRLDGQAWARRARLLVRWILFVITCYLGGVAATNLAPTVVETANYRAVVRLEVLPLSTPTLHSPTIVGDVDVAFSSPLLAPGLDVAVSVREEITSLLTAQNVTVQELQPTDAELGQAMKEAAIGVSLRFVLGALIVAVALSGSLHYGRRRRPRGAHLTLIASAVTATCALTAVGIASTYQPSRFLALTTTGVLGTVQRNAGMLEGVEARAAQVTPYLRNLLAVSQALQEKFVPAELNQPVAARILLVSDIHGTNQYSLMRTIIEQEGIDAVIDSGDLINFGRVPEAQAAGLLSGIESLGVPYIFVSGNHDAASPTDTDLLDRLAAVPNVVLLQRPNGDYTAYSFHGLQISGFNDPRWFGDDNKDPTAKERPAANAYNASMKDQPVSDLVVAHEPYAVTQVAKGDVLINGHIHTAALDGNRIQVGTFTGGGFVSHFTEGEDAELTGQPYAFDVATFGQQCQLTQLTRYSYRNLLEGRPAYDSIQVINGSRIEAAQAAPAAARQPGEPASNPEVAPRTCSRLEPTAAKIIPQVSDDELVGADTPSPSQPSPIPTRTQPSTPAGEPSIPTLGPATRASGTTTP